MSESFQIQADFVRDESEDLLVLKMNRDVREIRFDRVSAQVFIDHLSRYLAVPAPARPKPVLKLISTAPAPVESAPTATTLAEIKQQLALLMRKIEEIETK